VSITVENEREELRKVARSFLNTTVPAARNTRLVASEDGGDEAQWRSLTEMGWHALGLEEEVGGSGGTWLDLAVVLEEMGRVLLRSAFFATTVLGAQAIAAAGSEDQRRDWIGAIGRGDLTATVALPARDGRWEDLTTSVAVERDGDMWRASGTIERVVDGASAGLILVAGRTSAGPRLFAVDSGQPAVVSTPLETLDLTRPMARVDFSAATAVPLGRSDTVGLVDHAALLARLFDLFTVGLAAEQLGCAERSLEEAVSYAQQRTQYGQAIGSFQAIKHRCADVFVAVQAARSTLRHAATLVSESADDSTLALAASVAKVAASRAAIMAAAANIQIHGGIGITWEHDAHLYLRRAKSSELLNGSLSWHRERIAVQLATAVDSPAFQQSLLDGEMQAEAADFRGEVRAFLSAHLPADWQGVGALDEDERRQWLRAWRQTLADEGMMCVSWPTEYGGAGRSLVEQIALLEEFTNAWVPHHPSSLDTLAVNLLGPTIMAIGSEEQKLQRLPRIVSGEDRWCQGYSEPGAGSDLAGVQTTAVLKDGKWVINGQKVWTTSAHEANWMFALVRTDRTASKYAGLTFLLLPMDQPGVEVRPIPDLNGQHHLNEVFFTDAVTDEGNVLGAVNGGWAVANALLGYERNEGAIRDAVNFRDEFRRLVVLARDTDRLTDPRVRSGLVDAYVDLQAIILGAVRGTAAALAGQPPGPESSLHKLLWSEYHQRVTELSLDVYADKALTPTGRRSATSTSTDSPGSPSSSRSWVQTFLNARAGTIYAGTSEIQRNIIAEKLLQMPRSPRPATT
jgi:alkylation response protein AidB-like acyl-CoA dehydrogenase